jgi:hypothetical protein
LNRVSARLRRAAMTMLNGAKYRIKDQNVYSAANVADGSLAAATVEALLNDRNRSHMSFITDSGPVPDVGG